MIYTIDCVGVITDALSQYVRDQIQAANRQPDCEGIILKINSIGGSLIAAYNIIEAISASAKQVTTVNYFACFSAASLIWLHGSQRLAMPESLWLFHVASYGDGSEPDELLDRMNESMMLTYARATGKSIDTLESQWFDDGDLIMTLVDAQREGIVDGIYMPDECESTTDAECTMRNDEVVAEAKKIVAQAMTNKEKANAQVDDLEAANNEVIDASHEENEITDNVEEIDSDSDLNEDEIEEKIEYVTAKQYHEVVAQVAELKSIIDAMTAKPAAKTNTKVSPIDINAMLSDHKSNDPKTTWSIRDWEMKDPQGLLAIKRQSPEMYRMMFDAFYRK